MWRVRSRCLIRRGRLEPVEPRHLDVEQDHGEVAAEQLPRAPPRRTARDELVPERLEDRLERDEVLGRSSTSRTPRPLGGGLLSDGHASSVEEAADLVERAGPRRRLRRAIAASGISPRSAVARVLDDRDAARVA